MTKVKEQVLSDYIVILKLSWKVYDIMGHSGICNQIESIIEELKNNKDEVIKRDILNTIGLYIDNLRTYDDSIIIPEGKTLLSLIQ